MSGSRLHRGFFAVLLLIVAAVSVHDAALVVLLEDVVHDFEQNPLGRLLIELGHGGVGLFVLVKLLGTAVVCAVLVLLYQRQPQIALTVAVTLACFQVGLLLYLSLV